MIYKVVPMGSTYKRDDSENLTAFALYGWIHENTKKCTEHKSSKSAVYSKFPNNRKPSVPPSAVPLFPKTYTYKLEPFTISLSIVLCTGSWHHDTSVKKHVYIFGRL